MKRRCDERITDGRPRKLVRVAATDCTSKLSDELLLRIFSFVPVPTLLLSQRVSKRFSRIAVDSELWKAAYYRRFVLPRAARIPGVKDAGPSDQLLYSSKISKWLNEESLVRRGAGTNWKQQYRLRHNWSLGQCEVSEIIVADRPPEPPLLVIFQHGMILAADSISGLRVWESTHERALIAATPLVDPTTDTPRLPTSMAIDSKAGNHRGERIVLGFEDGSFAIFAVDKDGGTINSLFNHSCSSNGALSAVAFCSPYLLTMTESQFLSLYAFEEAPVAGPFAPPRLLYSLLSHTIWPPVSLSIRTNPGSVTASIAYALPTYLSGWTVGIQEMRLSCEGELLESRLATAAEQNYRSIAGLTPTSSPSTRASSPAPARPGVCESNHANISRGKPTSLSYSHPYLLVAHPDNTLTLYLVKSTASALSIGAGSRLWGHTSSVSGAQVGMRGKAVSVSRLGDELRVWDLEGGMPSSAARKRATSGGELSVRVQPARSYGELDLRHALDQGYDDTTVSQGWVGFDEQNVIVLREKGEGSQALFVYDFT